MKKLSRGFTIIELLIATLAFSLIIIVITTAVIRFSQQYYHGIIASATQSTARAVIDDVTRSMQYNSGSFYQIGTPARGYCIGSAKRYSFKLNQQINDTPPYSANQGSHALVSDTLAGCSTGSGTLDVSGGVALPSATSPRELLGNKMRLAKLDIAQYGDLYTVTVKVVYGDNDLLTSTTDLDKMQCIPQTGSAYCAVSELTTTINKRTN